MVEKHNFLLKHEYKLLYESGLSMTKKLRTALMKMNKGKLRSASYLHFKEQIEVIQE